MDIYKEKFTKLQREILRFLFIKSSSSFNQRQLAKNLKVSPTAISNSLKDLEKEKLIKIDKEKESNRQIIELNKKNPDVFFIKRIENLKLIFDSGLFGFLKEKFKLATIILFGSYSLGEDIERSDIDIAIIGEKEVNISLDKFENLLKRKITLQFYEDLNKIEKNLKSNILNGITLAGGVNI